MLSRSSSTSPRLALQPQSRRRRNTGRASSCLSEDRERGNGWRVEESSSFCSFDRAAMRDRTYFSFVIEGSYDAESCAETQGWVGKRTTNGGNLVDGDKVEPRYCRQRLSGRLLAS